VSIESFERCKKGVDTPKPKIYKRLMKNTKSPLGKWMEEQRWSQTAVAKETDMTRQAIHNHVEGKSSMSSSSVLAYKQFGVPRRVLQDHFSWMMDRA